MVFHPCVTDAQNPPLVLNMVIIPTVGRRKSRTGARRYRQETEKAAFHPRPPDAPDAKARACFSQGLIPPDKQ